MWWNILAGVGLALAFVSGFGGWIAFCDNKMCHQRNGLRYIVDGERASPFAYEFLRDKVDEVDANAHLWRLLTFRDPLVLYHEHLRRMYEKSNAVRRTT